MKALLSSIRQAGFDTKNIAIIGVNQRSINLVKEFSNHQEYGFIVKGVFNTSSNKEKTKIFYNETQISEIIDELNQFQDIVINRNIYFKNYKAFYDQYCRYAAHTILHGRFLVLINI